MIHSQLSAARIQHCLIEGDNLDMAWPAPYENGLRVATDSRALTGIAAEIIALTGWTDEQPPG